MEITTPTNVTNILKAMKNAIELTDYYETAVAYILKQETLTIGLSIFVVLLALGGMIACFGKFASDKLKEKAKDLVLYSFFIRLVMCSYLVMAV
jgi:hypothetical protein